MTTRRRPSHRFDLGLLRALVCAAFASATPTVTAQIELRGSTTEADGEVLRVDADGVTLAALGGGKPSSGAAAVLAWDRVRAVHGPFADQAALYASVSLQAWRARARLERGDSLGAEPIFDSLFSVYSRRTGPTTSVIAQGLAVCRLGRGAQASAVEPWLVWLRCAGTSDTSGIKDAIQPAIGWPSIGFAVDPSTGLLTTLPPIWIDTPAVRALAKGGSTLGALEKGVAPTLTTAKAERLAGWYMIGACSACQLPIPEFPEIGDDAGVKLVAEIVSASAGLAEQREAARSALRSRIKNKPAPWVEAWSRFALGRSLVKESSPDTRRMGIIELLHIPARFNDQVPYLTGLALAESSVALHTLGDDLGAEKLRSELQSDYAGHPALEWAPLRGWKVPKPQAKAAEK